jgi:hypothetical protein
MRDMKLLEDSRLPSGRVCWGCCLLRRPLQVQPQIFKRRIDIQCRWWQRSASSVALAVSA